MSQVEGVAKTSPGTLLLAIGAQHIECAVLLGSGASERWHPGSLRKVAIHAAEGIESTSQAVLSALQRLQAEPALPPVAQVRVLVADCWLAVGGVPWSARLQRGDSARNFAWAQLQSAGFELRSEDTLKIDDAPFGAPRLVVAYPAALMVALAQWALHLNARLASVQASSLAAWAFAQRHGGGTHPQALVVMDAGLLLLGRAMLARQPRMNELTVRALAQGQMPTPQDVRGLWQRLCLREPPLAAVQRVAVLDLCGAGDGLALEQPFTLVHLPAMEGALGVSGALRLAAAVRAWQAPMEAVGGAASPAAWRWPAMAGAALLAGVLVWQAMLANQALRAVSARLDASSVAPVAPKTTTWSREERARVQAVNAAIRELNLPIAGLLSALEPPRDIAVAVLSVEHSGGVAPGANAGLKITAEARTGEDMARYVAFVATRKPFTGAYLTRHEVEAGAAEQPYRFTLEASWGE